MERPSPEPIPSRFEWTSAKAALAVAHPSHELRVHGWLQKARPVVFVLTDGGGRSDEPRLSATTRVLEEAGTTRGAIFGYLTDLELYAAILRQDFDFFVAIAEQLANAFIAEQIEYVAGDAEEGYSSAHDVCRSIINTAVAIANGKQQRIIRNYDFLVVQPPEEYSTTHNGDAILIDLEEEAFARKIAAAHGYSPELATDVEAALKGEKFFGIKRFSEPTISGQVDVALYAAVLSSLKSRPALDAQMKGVFSGVDLHLFRRECLRAVSNGRPPSDTSDEPRYYEIYAENLVAAGLYKQVIRYREHVQPIAEALYRHVASANCEAFAHSNHQ